MSVNDGIEPEMCSMHYTSVDEVAKRVTALGKGAVLAKFDVESAYWMIPVHHSDRRLLGMKWRGKVYVDTALSFGFQSVPEVYNAVADALQWILEREGITIQMTSSSSLGPQAHHSASEYWKRR